MAFIVVCELLILLAVIYGIPYAAVAALALGSMHFFFFKTYNQRKAAIGAALDSIIADYTKGRSAVRAALHSTIPELREVARTYMLGDFLREEEAKQHSHIDELKNMLSYGIVSGRDICESLKMMKGRLEYEAGVLSAIKEHAGSMELLAYVGVVFFVPLFGGISASIMGSLTTMGGGGVQAGGFMLIILIYVTFILCITSSLAKPEAGMLEKAYAIAPALLISSSILFSLPPFMNGIL